MKPKIKRHVGGLRPDRYLTDEQIKTLMQYLRTGRTERGAVNLFAVTMMLFTGLRAAELLNLQIRDLPYHHGKDVVLVMAGKGCVSRTVLIPAFLGCVIEQFIREHRRGGKPGSYLFVAEGKSSPMLYDSLYRRLVLIGQKSGIGRLTPHMLRHVYAITLYDRARDLLFVQSQLGHANVETTGIYAKTRPESGRQQVESLPFFGTETIKHQENTGKLDVSNMLGL